ncbi:MAG: hypothetical protein M3285_10355 [Actinomycetota bacterium]|nr:hypothetical protein [Actinomycetota bacterium]
MSFEDRLQNLLQRADGAIPPEPSVSWEATIMQAHRDRIFYASALAAATAVVVAIAAISVTALLRDGESQPIPPAGTPTAEETPESRVTESPEEAPTCPAAGLSPIPEEQSDLPPAVATTREEIVAAAVACDYERLGLIVEAGGRSQFTFSFGEEATHEAFVASLRRSDGETLDILVRTLDLPYCTQRLQGRLLYQWPSAFCADATDEDWDALRELYSDEDIARWREFETFGAHRIGIDADGAWLFFVGGD